MDELDYDIISLLREDSRTPVKEMARKLDTTWRRINSRIKRLEEDNVILKYTLALSSKYRKIKAAYIYPTEHPIGHILPSTKEDTINDIIKEAAVHPDVLLLARLKTRTQHRITTFF